MSEVIAKSGHGNKNNGIGKSSNNNRQGSDTSFVQVCCTWGNKLEDGILTYKIVDGGSGNSNNGDLLARQAVIDAINEWNKDISGIKMVESSSNTDSSGSGSDNSPDILIKLNAKAIKVKNSAVISSSGKGGSHSVAPDKRIRLAIPGESQLELGSNGFLSQVQVTISNSIFGNSLDEGQLKQIAMHEIGHALGIGHASFTGDLMSPIVNPASKVTISQCDINAVLQANQWKVTGDNPQSPNVNHVNC
jgi:hypothetical protein